MQKIMSMAPPSDVTIGAEGPLGSQVDWTELCVESNSFVVRNGTRRHANLATVLSVEDPDMGTMRFRVLNEVAAWLAFYHMTHPELHILPEVGARFSDCDIDFSLRMFDDHYERLTAARHLSDLFENFSCLESELDQVPPIALLGSVRTPSTSILSVLSSSFGIPLISSGATSAYLDNREIHPMFARTVPSSTGDARAVVSLLEHFHVSHFAVLYVADDFGKAFHADVLAAADQVGLTTTSFGYENNNEAEITDAIKQLKSSGLRYVVAILHSEYKNVVDEATKVGLLNSTETTWFLTVASSALGDEGIKIDPVNALALNGMGLVRIWVDKEASALSQEMVRFSNSTDLQSMYISARDDNSTFSNFSFQDLALDPYIYLTYDAMTALGLAACTVPNGLFNGSQLYDQLRKTEFDGVSGPVRFNPTTGTRSDDFKFEVKNLLVSSEHELRSVTSYIINLSNKTSDTRVQMRTPFIFPDGTTTPPDSLPPPDHVTTIDVELGPVIVGLILAALVMVSSVGWMYWTWRNRDKDIVKAAQPIFLWQLCIGTLLMASSIIAMSMQEGACMVPPWLLSIGFVTTWSALFAKTWRLNRMLRSTKTFRRVKTGSVDVMIPFFVMLAVNVAVLLVWTLKAPLTWEWHELGGFDKYGRPTESYGACGPSGSLEELWSFLGPILGINMIAFAVTMHQCYQARHAPSDFSEAISLFWSMGFVLETLIVGVPLLFVAFEDPSAQFLIQTILVCIVCLGILVPVFIPKYCRRSVMAEEAAFVNANQRRPAAQRNNSFVGDPSEYDRATDRPVENITGFGESADFGVIDENFIGTTPANGLANIKNNRLDRFSPKTSGHGGAPLCQPSNLGPMPPEFRMNAGLSSSFGSRLSVNGMPTTAMQVYAEADSGEDQASGQAGTSRVSRSDPYFTCLASGERRLLQSGARRSDS
jgi:Receptor family ligand binding region/7 transmembrane sweet-taste receptor of 3 GCPR